MIFSQGFGSLSPEGIRTSSMYNEMKVNVTSLVRAVFLNRVEMCILFPKNQCNAFYQYK